MLLVAIAEMVVCCLVGEAAALQALGRVNGFVMKGKPVIISFGKKKKVISVR